MAKSERAARRVTAARKRRRIAGTLWRVAARVTPDWTGRIAFRAFCRPPRTTEGAGEARLVERMAPLFARARAMDVATEDGKVSTFVWRTETGQARGRVLLVHGWSARAYVMGMFVEPLLKAGFDVVALDLPAHGQSSGRQLSMPIGARAILSVERALGPITHAITHSFGGTVVALAAEGGPPIHSRLTALKRVVFIASPNRLDAMTRAFAERRDIGAAAHAGLDRRVTLRAGRPIGEIEIGQFLAKAGIPALIIHDEHDEDVPFQRAEAICARAPLAQLMATQGLGHRRIVITSGVIRAAVRFLGAGA
jgi:pimeloyl-ACP methyl ester carboxylesterase